MYFIIIYDRNREKNAYIERVEQVKVSIDENRTYEKTPHVIIQCQAKSKEVYDIVKLLETKDKKIIGSLNEVEHVIKPREVLYFESVDGITYAYTKEKVYRTKYTLTELEATYQELGYFRCSKSMVLNIHAIQVLRSEVGCRIDACLVNGEHSIISRHYAKQLRAILEGGEQR